MKSYHPLTIFITYMAIIALSFIQMDPVIIALSFLFSFILFIIRDNKYKKQTILSFLVLFILIAITNPLFVQSGETILFTIFKLKITMEALVYGVFIGLMLINVSLWFSIYNKDMTSEKMLFLFGKILPNISLVISMIFRFIPKFIDEYREIKEVKYQFTDNKKSLYLKTKEALLNTYGLLNISLEKGIITSDSMKARGYGNKRRTIYNKYRFKLKDIIVSMLSFSLIVAIIVLSVLLPSFVYYPHLSSIELTLALVVRLGLCVCLLTLPIILHIKEKKNGYN